MVALQIRGVSEEVRQALAARARERGQSLQAFLLWLVEEEARRAGNVALLERLGQRSDGSRVSAGAVTEALDAARDARDRQLVQRAQPAAGGCS